LDAPLGVIGEMINVTTEATDGRGRFGARLKGKVGLGGW